MNLSLRNSFLFIFFLFISFGANALEQQLWTKVDLSKKLTSNLDFIQDSQLRFDRQADVINFTIRPGLQWNTQNFGQSASFALLFGFMNTSDIERRPTLQHTQHITENFKIRTRYEFRDFEKKIKNSHRLRFQFSYGYGLTATTSLHISEELNFKTYQTADQGPLRFFSKNRLALSLRFDHLPMRPSMGPIYEYIPRARGVDHLLAWQFLIGL